VFDFIEANFAILIVFEFFLMTAENAEKRPLERSLCDLGVSAVKHVFGNGRAEW